MVRIGYSSNIAALQAQRSLATSSSAFTTTLERLSSGLRINRASDDAAGLSIATRLKSDVRVYSQGIRNINDGLSVLNVAQGTLTQLSSITMRLQELATQGSNGTFGAAQRRALNGEADQLVAEFNRLAGSANFNGLNIFDGTLSSLDIQAGHSSIQFSLGRSLSRRTGTGAFEETYGIGDNSMAEIGVGDLDNDGLADTVRSDLMGGATIIYGNGSTEQLLGVENTSDLVRIADINGDGRNDIVFASTSEKGVNVFLQTADGFSVNTFTVATATKDFEAGDFNGDGKIDLIFADDDGKRVSLYFGDGAGGFTFGSLLATGIDVNGLAIADLDNDGDMDFGVLEDENFVRLFRNNGYAASFTNYQNLVSLNSYSLEFGDLNRDGKVDVVTGGRGNLWIGLQQGAGIFGALQDQQLSADLGSPRISSLRVVDIDGDGRLDVLAAGEEKLAVLLGNGQGGFHNMLNSELRRFGQGTIGVGDFNGDGVLDIAFGASGSTTDIALGIGQNTPSLAYIDLQTREGALAALSVLSQAQLRLASEISTLGASQSRLGTAAEVLAATRENLINAGARIMDADMAFESANLIRLKILKESSAAVLAQANQSPQLALMLLRN